MKKEIKIDPVCLVHGKKLSEHHCLYCCLCYKSLEVDQCYINKGQKVDLCVKCGEYEFKGRL